jgi:hypothetical protein
MGIVLAWVITCDGGCASRMTVSEQSLNEATSQALDSGWSLAYASDREIVRPAWYCPSHRYLASTTVPLGDHEEWCPRRTRNGPCSCEADSFRKPHLVDDGFSQVPDIRALQTVQPGEEFL